MYARTAAHGTFGSRTATCPVRRATPGPALLASLGSSRSWQVIDVDDPLVTVIQVVGVGHCVRTTARVTDAVAEYAIVAWFVVGSAYTSSSGIHCSPVVAGTVYTLVG